MIRRFIASVMPRSTLLFLLLMCIVTHVTGSKANRRTVTLRVASFNNQYDNTRAPAGAGVWKGRLPLVLQMLREEKFDIVGMQEPYWHQVKDMDEALKKDYAWVGCSVRGQLKNDKRHYNPIFYRWKRFELLRWGSFWYSETPWLAGSKSWDSYSPRMCVWAEFRDKKSGIKFYHFNSHFDHLGETARRKSAQILLQKVKDIAHGAPAFCTGDFNADEKSETYRILTQDGLLDDSYNIAAKRINANMRSYNGYTYPLKQIDNAQHIDHLFVTKGTSVPYWRLVTTAYEGKYPSDHCPIVVEWTLPGL